MKVSVHFVALILLFICGCQPAIQTVQIRGQVDNSKAEKVKLTSDEQELELEIIDGKFTTQFEIKDPAFYTFRIGRESSTFFLEPGQSLGIFVDAEEFDESIQYTGTGSESSNYLAAKYLHQEQQLIGADSLYRMDESAFLDQLSKNENDGYRFLESYNPGLSKNFVVLEKVNIEFDQKNYLLTYESAHAHYAGIEGFKASEKLNKLIEDINLNQSSYIGSPSFSRFVTSFISSEGYKLSTTEEKYSKLGNNGMIKASLDLISSTISNAEVQAHTTDKIIKQTLSYSSALGIEPFIKEIQSLTQNQTTYDLIDKSLNEWGHLAEGMPAPDFDGMTIDGKSVKLSDLLGKNVYIDVWATWCGPCLREQSALFELEEKYKNNKNLAFMGVSIDSDKDAWTKMVAENDMKGEQIFTEGAWKSVICTDYLIKGIPRFILVDKKGNIIDSDAPRPSSDQIKGIISDLAGEPLLSSL